MRTKGNNSVRGTWPPSASYWAMSADQSQPGAGGLRCALQELWCGYDTMLLIDMPAATLLSAKVRAMFPAWPGAARQ
jgi:hypothetical protein